MGEKKLSYFLMDIIILIVFLGFIELIFTTTKFNFLAELFITVILLFLAFIGLMGFFNKKRWSTVLLYFVFLILTLNILLFRYHGRKSMGILLLSTLGLLMALGHIKKKEPEFVENVKEEFTPGKYLASKSGKTYHAPKCDWALKIKEANRVWLETDDEAKKKGYKKHSCLE
ncbi:MAG: hypothetical protein KJ601_05100 [Nanoarchaeota archaeon]|nr:hypothetical protein [Nanoarchaeota archaeon]